MASRFEPLAKIEDARLAEHDPTTFDPATVEIGIIAEGDGRLLLQELDSLNGRGGCLALGLGTWPLVILQS